MIKSIPITPILRRDEYEYRDSNCWYYYCYRSCLFSIKKKEARLVLIGAVILMALIAGKPMSAFKAFSDNMVTAPLIQAILSIMGFAYILKFTECDKHLVAGGLKKNATSM
ncbi:hypothetical protein ACE38V_01160 [Cytobacillus sp. Hz8]|uniref:hypothetical protein n=1 Tax=Cytobacillus sp. Hz8 TaxID=3347168 RepID=UPI0035D8A76C